MKHSSFHGLPKPEYCSGCLLCLDVCRYNALYTEISSEGFRQVKAEESKCRKCGSCVKYCPILKQDYGSNNLQVKTNLRAAWSNCNEIRHDSSSGGVFSEFALNILNNGGFVVGAELVDGDVVHTIIGSKNDLARLRRAKYSQSNTTGIYIKVRALLRNGHKVLFSGTPCQVAAILEFCKNEPNFENLWSVDLICHGVPSIRIFDLLRKLWKLQSMKICSFRDKLDGWESSSCITYLDENQQTHRIPASRNLFIDLYCRDLTLRRSCYHCQFRKIHRKSDFTLGDFWGYSGSDDNQQKGVSAVLAHTTRALNLLHSLNISDKEANIADCCRINYPLYTHNALRFHPARIFLPLIFQYCPASIQYRLLSGNFEKKIIWKPIRIVYAALFRWNAFHLKKCYHKYFG